MPFPALRRFVTLCGLLSIAILQASCATMTDSSAKTDWSVVVTKVSCTAFEPITWSAKDTAATVAQIKAHNAVFKAVCK